MVLPGLPAAPSWAGLLRRRLHQNVMNRSIPAQIKEARTLIGNSREHASIQQALTDFGYPIQNLEKGQALLEQFLLLQRAKRQNYGAKLNATETVVNELQHWVRGYRAIVRVALADDPQLLEVLGLLVRV